MWMIIRYTFLLALLVHMGIQYTFMKYEERVLTTEYYSTLEGLEQAESKATYLRLEENSVRREVEYSSLLNIDLHTPSTQQVVYLDKLR